MMLTFKEIYQIKNDCLERAGLKPCRYIVTFEYNNRFTRRLGDASRSSESVYHIRLSRKLFALCPRETQENTVRHEMAHVINWILNGRFVHRENGNHGHKWKAIAMLVGAKPEACSEWREEYRQLKRKMTKYRMPCKCRTHDISPQRYRKMLRGYVFRCLHCFGDLDHTQAIKVKV